ncbi:hypothetical protein WR25_07837 [Diploscapter pachys]|uniref:Fungal lipase-type domain-containing protein n=1 Tax=Diploscapter pachys TaxID=2018661 RepID=A0A2A2JFG1_9BILA|nr:hypothetical protein WR25_07837 [Diploscapter pachys]
MLTQNASIMRLHLVIVCLVKSSILALNNLEFNPKLAKFALDFAAGAYGDYPVQCHTKRNSTLIFRYGRRCDAFHNECWAIIGLTDEWITVAFRGTQTKVQLIAELLESMTEPKHKIRAGGSVQHYFYVALDSIWAPINKITRKLKYLFPNRKILFTGHSLGGALASLASTVFADHHPKLLKDLYLITFGEPRVGNFEYAQAHDRLVPNSWRIVHRYDLVAHIPLCGAIYPRSCSPLFNHAPYHHGIEIWYQSNMTDTDLFRLCTGNPLNEDDSCSNAWYIHYNVNDHLTYYEHQVSKYGENGCVDPSDKSLTQGYESFEID